MSMSTSAHLVWGVTVDASVAEVEDALVGHTSIGVDLAGDMSGADTETVVYHILYDITVQRPRVKEYRSAQPTERDRFVMDEAVGALHKAGITTTSTPGWLLYWSRG